MSLVMHRPIARIRVALRGFYDRNPVRSLALWRHRISQTPWMLHGLVESLYGSVRVVRVC